MTRTCMSLGAREQTDPLRAVILNEGAKRAIRGIPSSLGVRSGPERDSSTPAPLRGASAQNDMRLTCHPEQAEPRRGEARRRIPPGKRARSRAERDPSTPTTLRVVSAQDDRVSMHRFAAPPLRMTERQPIATQDAIVASLAGVRPVTSRLLLHSGFSPESGRRKGRKPPE